MGNNMTIEKCSGVAQLLHWLISPLVILQFILAWTADALPEGDTQSTLYLVHKSVGMTVLALAIVRLAWRFMHTPPAFPAIMPRAEQWLARITHWGLYFLIFAMPLSGWLWSSAAGRGVPWFGVFTFPTIIGESESIGDFFHETHELLAWVLFAFALFHILAALWHAIVKKDGVLQRMLP
ncbi:MAG: cytochrome b [Proteobacteria bacterium]|nr:cytochrome b [Pseudomonadota bacterium]